ncbi:hypothetical protein ACUOCP_54235, partial [Escherichia sp. R-CC3]
MAFHMKKLEDESRTGAKQSFVAEQLRRHQETPQVGRLLSLYVDDSVADPTPFGEVRQRAYQVVGELPVTYPGIAQQVEPGLLR